MYIRRVTPSFHAQESEKLNLIYFITAHVTHYGLYIEGMFHVKVLHLIVVYCPQFSIYYEKKGKS